ncbi:MAG: hypothetical protein E6767_12820 [Dysgonomonas sp.]|nr:hypothetical protein [Dysgonomonas sp.]
MRNEKNILKQNSLASGIIIKLCLWVAGFALCAWVVTHLSINTSVVFGCVLAYMGICLVFKVVKFVLKVILSLLSFIIITALILLLIF